MRHIAAVLIAITLALGSLLLFSTAPVAGHDANDTTRVATTTGLPGAATTRTPLVKRTAQCPQGKGTCSNGVQDWCCNTYPNYPYCGCGNYPGTCTGRCY
jgi:hypothetical protein